MKKGTFDQLHAGVNFKTAGAVLNEIGANNEFLIIFKGISNN